MQKQSAGMGLLAGNNSLLAAQLQQQLLGLVSRPVVNRPAGALLCWPAFVFATRNLIELACLRPAYLHRVHACIQLTPLAAAPPSAPPAGHERQQPAGGPGRQPRRRQPAAV